MRISWASFDVSNNYICPFSCRFWMLTCWRNFSFMFVSMFYSIRAFIISSSLLALGNLIYYHSCTFLRRNITKLASLSFGCSRKVVRSFWPAISTRIPLLLILFMCLIFNLSATSETIFNTASFVLSELFAIPASAETIVMEFGRSHFVFVSATIPDHTSTR